MEDVKPVSIIIRLARRLRRTQTPAEIALWKRLRDRRLQTIKFKRQVPIGPYIADFCSKEHDLIIEVDGWIHQLKEKSDAERTKYLEENGYKVIRFSNTQILESMDWVLEEIKNACNKTFPLPQTGEG